MVSEGLNTLPPFAAYDTQSPWFLNVFPVPLCSDFQPLPLHASFASALAALAGLANVATAIVAATANTAARDFHDLTIHPLGCRPCPPERRRLPRQTFNRQTMARTEI